MGFSSALCREVALGVGKLNMQCSSGRIQKIVSYGVIPTDAVVRDVCLASADTKKCDLAFNGAALDAEIS